MGVVYDRFSTGKHLLMFLNCLGVAILAASHIDMTMESEIKSIQIFFGRSNTFFLATLIVTTLVSSSLLLQTALRWYSGGAVS